VRSTAIVSGNYHVWRVSRRRSWPFWRRASGTPGDRISPAQPLPKRGHEFVETFGHRALYEVEMANPRWREQPDYLFEVFGNLYQSAQTRVLSTPRSRPAGVRLLNNRSAVAHVLASRLVSRHAATCPGLFQPARNSKSHLVLLIDIGRLMALRAADF